MRVQLARSLKLQLAFVLHPGRQELGRGRSSGMEGTWKQATFVFVVVCLLSLAAADESKHKVGRSMTGLSARAGRLELHLGASRLSHVMDQRARLRSSSACSHIPHPPSCNAVSARRKADFVGEQSRTL